MAEKSEVIKVDVCQGLGASNKTKINIDKLNKPNNYFEYMGEGKIRVFIDIDGAVSYEGFNKKAFKECDNANIAALITIPDVGIMSASHYDSQKWVYNYTTKENEHIKTCPKFSYRITYINEYFEDSNAEMLEYVKTVKAPELKALFKEMGALSIGNVERDGTILDIDESVYKSGKSKMRCVNAYKDKEQPDRINRIIKGDLCDQLLTYIPEEAKLCKVAGFIGKPKKIKASKESKSEDGKSEDGEIKAKRKYVKKITNLPAPGEKVTEDQFTKLINGIGKHRWNNYYDWIRIYWIFLNEKQDINLFEYLSEKYYDTSKGKYSLEKNENARSGKICNGYKIGTLYSWLEIDNNDLFLELQTMRRDFWHLMNNLNHMDLANLYYSIKPHKYIRSNLTGWYEYNSHNRLLSRGPHYPSSLQNDITITLRDYITTQRNYSKIGEEDYEKKMKLILVVYNKVGEKTYINGIQSFLTDLYTKDDFDELLDAKNHLLAFNNGLYDIKQKAYRKIKPDDYITLSTKYDMPHNKKEDYDYVKDEVTKNYIDDVDNLLLSIFNTPDLIEYYKIIMGLSFFTNKLEMMLIHTGSGGNGKGILTTFYSVALGPDYYMAADPAFLSTKFKSGPANSILANSKGKRMLVVTEPPDSKEERLNLSFIKSITGRDAIAARDLNKKHSPYDPFFNVNLQTNVLPIIEKIDGGASRRFEIIPYENKFVKEANLDILNPKHKLIDMTLKDKILGDSENNDLFKKAFMYVLISKAAEWFDRDINELVRPAVVIEATNDYVEENNHLKYWISEYLEILPEAEIKPSERIPKTQLHKIYNECEDVKHLNAVDFEANMKFNGFIPNKKSSTRYYIGIKYKIITLNKDGSPRTPATIYDIINGGDLKKCRL